MSKSTNDKDLVFQIIDCNITHEDVEYENEEIQKYVIRLYGRTQDNKTVFLKVENFQPYFFVEIPKDWGTLQVNRFVNAIKKNVYRKQQNSLVTHNIVKRHKFYGFSNDELYNFVVLKFHGYWGFKAYEKVLKKPFFDRSISKYPKKYELYESNIEPALRFMHITNIKACGWISVVGDKLKDVSDGESTVCDINKRVNWKFINYVDNPKILPIVVASFDIECTSGDGSFPQANRDTDKIIQIGTTFHRYGEDECFYKHIVTLGSCDKINGVDVESYDKEGDVLIAWTKMIARTNPDVLTGYNIFGFDYKYMYDRAVKLGVNKQFMMLNRNVYGDQTKLKDKKLESSALGRNILYYFDMLGRVQIDLMKVVQKDFNLSSYKLDSVAANFIRENIKNIICDEKTKQTTIITPSTYGLKKGGYITIYFNDGLSDNKYDDGKKFIIKKVKDDSIVIRGILNVDELNLGNYKVFWCQAKDDVSPNEIFRLQKGSSKDRAKIAKYCIKDCVLVNKLVAKLQVLTNNISMANVCNVPLSYLFLRGQGVKIFSLVSKKCREKKYLIPVVRKKSDEEIEEEKRLKRMEREARGEEISEEDVDDEINGYEGATVLDPHVDAHFMPIPVLDYASLYPRSMIHRNLSHECLLDDVVEFKGKINRITASGGTVIDILNKELLRKIVKNYLVKLVWRDEDETIHEAKFKVTKVRVKDEYIEVENNILQYEKTNKLINCKLYCKNYVLEDLEGYIYKTIYPTYKGVTTKCVFAQREDGTMGIVPEILQNLLDARQMFKDKKKQEKDPFLKEIWDGTQLAYKITANSLYGQTGAPTSPIYLKAVASSTTATGRELLNGAKLFTEYLFSKLLFCTVKKDFKGFTKKINQLFNKKYDKLLEKHEIKELKTPNKDGINEYDYFRIFSEKREKLNDECFINKKLNHQNKKDFIKYLYDRLVAMLNNKTVAPKCVYGDSVTGDTPIVIKNKLSEQIQVVTIEELTDNWCAYDEFKPFDTYESNRKDKEQSKNSLDYQVWSDNGWTDIKRGIRHRCNKKIYRVCTHTGIIDVTEDHSLLDKNGKIIKPSECIIGTELLHSPIEFKKKRRNTV
ncbi:MAG: hypothetical protein CMF62_02335 [Magnetococcales bacterium]|nr:hypothetical protein [Magnetococcales bacterium]